MQFAGVDDRNAAEALRGTTVRAEALGDAPDGELCVHELIGAEVRDRAGARIGRVDVGAGESRARPARARQRRAGPDGVRRRARAGRRRGRSARRVCSISAMRIDVFTIFPDYLDRTARGVARRAARARPGCSTCACTIRATFTTDVHRSVDDAPFGGGAGMVMMPEPLFAAVEAVQPPRPLLLLSASGPRFDQARARELAAGDGFSLLCGRYEGVDQRVADHCCDGELSVGDYVLAGGEAAALVVIEAVTRLVPGVMGNEASSAEESFGPDGVAGSSIRSTRGRPASASWDVPEVLRSGDHARVARWRRAQALRADAGAPARSGRPAARPPRRSGSWASSRRTDGRPLASARSRLRTGSPSR